MGKRLFSMLISPDSIRDNSKTLFKIPRNLLSCVKSSIPNSDYLKMNVNGDIRAGVKNSLQSGHPFRFITASRQESNYFVAC